MAQMLRFSVLEIHRYSDIGEAIRDAYSELSQRNEKEGVNEILQLARQAVAIECHYDKPMDIKWAIDVTFEN